jgi:hypothetical protein
MKRVIILSILFLAVGFSQNIYVNKNDQVRLAPRMLNYQGYLTDTLNNPITNPSISMTFAVFDAVSAGNQKWTETQSAVSVDKGIFHVLLGSVTPIPDSVFNNTNRWLELSVAGQTLTPRTRIVSVPFAYSATYADTAQYSRAAAADNDWTRSAGKVYTANTTDSVGIGTATPIYKLQVNGGVGISNGLYMNTTSINEIQNLNFSQVLGNGIRFYNNPSYGINFGGMGEFSYGPVTSYSIKMNMPNAAGYGWVWGIYGQTPVAALGINGNMQLAGNLCVIDSIGIGTSSPTRELDINGNMRLTHALYDCNNEPGTNGQVLSTTGNGVDWIDAKDNDWIFRVTDGADTTLQTGGRWGLTRLGNVLFGNADSTHVNFGVACTTGRSAWNDKYCTISGGYNNNAYGSSATVGGGYENTADSSYATVGGGYSNEGSGGYATVGGGYNNTVSANLATVAGGYENTARGTFAAVGGGHNNIASYDGGTVGGGEYNLANGAYVTVGGGTYDTASAYAATVGGGYSNVASGSYTTVGGGSRNTASGGYAMAGGGYGNSAIGNFSTIPGGAFNSADSSYATVGGGRSNVTDGSYATIGGGYLNDAFTVYCGVGSGYSNRAGNASVDTGAVVAGGYDNGALEKYSFVGGGLNNTASGINTTVAGGSGNAAIGTAATVGGGTTDTASGTWAVVAGGESNIANNGYATVSGGLSNAANAYYATVSGGRQNTANKIYATVGGGYNDMADTDYAIVGGGWNNVASGYSATVGGGRGNSASYSYATIAGGIYNDADTAYATVGGGYYNAASGYAATVAGGYRDSSLANYSFTQGNNASVSVGFDGSAAFNGQTSTASGQTRVGILSKASGTFTIDHPLDPEHKILNHYFVESPEMVLIYRGKAIIGEDGRCAVHLPDYFDALNENPQIQLTGVGTYEVFIAENEKNNGFVIGGKPGTEVHWTVTGCRKDPSAEITKILMPVEQVKEGGLAGRSLDDELLVSTMAQLERMGKADGFKFRHASEQNRYEEMKRMIEEGETKK